MHGEDTWLYVSIWHGVLLGSQSRVNAFSLFSQLSCDPCLFRFSSSLSNISLSTLGNIGMSFTCLPILGLCMLILTHLSPLLMHYMHWLILEVTLYCGVSSNSNVFTKEHRISKCICSISLIYIQIEVFQTCVPSLTSGRTALFSRWILLSSCGWL